MHHQMMQMQRLLLACVGEVHVDTEILQKCFANANYTLSIEQHTSFQTDLLTGKDLVLLGTDVCDSDMIEALTATRTLVIVIGDDIETEALLSLLRRGVADVLPASSSSDALALHLLALLGSKKNQVNLYPHAVGETMQGAVLDIAQALRSETRAIHLHGETGTGKEVAAQALAHLIRPNKLVSVNCAVIQTSLQASFLFGHCRGAFTDAAEDKVGLIEQADGGWLFLDEVACLHLEVQAALLRVLENGEYMRVGESKPRQADVKILSATNKAIPSCIEEGAFRVDLWQRLRELEIYLPPVRARRVSELKELIKHFLTHFPTKGVPANPSYKLSPSALSVLTSYDWNGGNVRELRNCLRSMTTKDTDGMLTVRSLPTWLVKSLTKPQPQLDITSSDIFHDCYSAPFEVLTQLLLLKCIEENFKRHGQSSIRQLANRLSLAPNTLSRKLKSLLDTNQVSVDKLNTYVQICADTIIPLH